MALSEIKASELDADVFIQEKVQEIIDEVSSQKAIVALSGGVDSSTVTVLGDKALGDRLGIYFIDNGLMRKGEPKEVQSIFERLGIDVEIVAAQGEFLKRLQGKIDPEEKRRAIIQAFYEMVLPNLIRDSEAEYLLQGTIFTDIEEAQAGIKSQHNVLDQVGVSPEYFGYQVIEPLKQLRKDGVRKIAEELGLPPKLYTRIPFPGPALAARILGEVTPEKIKVVREATAIVENHLRDTGAFQYLAVLHEDKVTGIRDGKRKLGNQIEIRCWESEAAVTARPTNLTYERLMALSEAITSRIKEVVSVTYNISPKPPSTIEPV